MPVPFTYRELVSPTLGVDAIWTYSVEVDAAEPVAHVVLPDGCLDIIYRRDASSRGNEATLLAAGPSERPQVIEVAPGTCFVGLRFDPGWGGACLGVAPLTLTDRVAPLSELGLPGWICDLAALAPEDIPRRFRLLAAELAAAASPDRRAVDAVRLLKVSGGRMPLHEIARTLGLPQRTFRRVITETVGVSPKSLARLLRFRRSLQLRKRDGSLGLAALALEAGYADQAHMTREYRALGGFSPGRFPRLLVS